LPAGFLSKNSDFNYVYFIVYLAIVVKVEYITTQWGYMWARYERKIHRTKQRSLHYLRNLPLHISLTLGVSVVVVLGIAAVATWANWEMRRMVSSSQSNNPSARMADMNKRLVQVSLLAIAGMSVGTFFYTRFVLALRSANQESTSLQTINTHFNSEAVPERLKTMNDVDRHDDTHISNLKKQQRQLIDIISHELRTPLTIVYGYLQSALRHSNNLTPEQRQGLEVATQETDRTIHLLQELLDQGRSENYYLDFKRENLDLNMLIMEVVEMVRDSPMPMPNIAFEVLNSPIDAPITIGGDRVRLKQSFMRIIDYLLDRASPQSDISLTLEQIEDRAILQICDRSCELPLDEQVHLFDRFYRSNATQPDAHRGDSSLATVKMTIEGMNGTIEVRSPSGEGSIFTITLPAVV
jgi:signal transduction histidine kinase